MRRAAVWGLALAGVAASGCDASHEREDDGGALGLDAASAFDAGASDAALDAASVDAGILDAPWGPDGGPLPTCAVRELVAVSGADPVTITSLAWSGDHGAATGTYRDTSWLSIFDADVRLVVDVALDAPGYVVDTDEGFAVAAGDRVRYFDRDGLELGAATMLGGMLAGGPNAFARSSTRLWARVVEAPSGSGPARLISLPLAPGGTVFRTSIVLAEGSSTFAAGNDGRVLLLEGGDGWDTVPRIRDVTIEGETVTSTAFDRTWDDGFAAVASAVYDPSGGGWIVAGASRVPDTRTFLSRLARVGQDGATTVTELDEITTYEGSRGSALVDPDGTIHAIYRDPYNSSATTHVTIGAGGVPALEPLGGASYRTGSALVRTGDGCHAVLLGTDAEGTMIETRVIVRFGP